MSEMNVQLPAARTPQQAQEIDPQLAAKMVAEVERINSLLNNMVPGEKKLVVPPKLGEAATRKIKSHFEQAGWQITPNQIEQTFRAGDSWTEDRWEFTDRATQSRLTQSHYDK